jgi:zinc transport system substrate-binding protein
MKNKIFIFITLLSTMTQAAPLNVWCGIPPLTSVVKTVGGERVKVASLMTGSQDPHTFSPSPKAVAGAREACVFFTVGMPFESTVAEKLKAMNPELQVVNLAEGIPGLDDPHVWMSLPVLAEMAAVIEQALSRIDPGGAGVYQSNCKAFQQQLAGRHEVLKLKLKPFQGVTFYVYHPSFGYFAQDYGLNQEAVELEGKSPSPKQLLGLINRARKENVRIVFVQPQFSDKSARILAERIGGRVVPVNQLAEDPVSVIEQAAESIVQSYESRQKP